MLRSSNDLIAAVTTAAGGALILLASGNSALQLVVALPLLLILPGYTITAALFPRHTLGIPEQLFSSIGLSLAAIVIGGFALHWTPWGLQTGSWVVFIFFVIVTASLIAMIRRQRDLPTAAIPLHVGLNGRQGLLLGLAVLVVAAAIGLARTPLPPQGLQGYTLLWILPAGDGRLDAVRLGVSSEEFVPVAYKLQVTMDDQLVEEWPVIQLAPGEQWETTAALPANMSGTAAVEATLYRLDAPNVVYRRVTLR
jgi:hypothetical protein